MRINEYIYQTGECIAHDTDAGLAGPYDLDVIQTLIAKRSGFLPGTKGLHYLFDESAHSAHLSVAGKRDELIFMAEIMPYLGPAWPKFSNLEWAVQQFDIVAEPLNEGDWPIPKRLPNELAVPCIITLLLPRTMQLHPKLVALLRSVRRDFACIWLLFGSQANRAQA